MLIDFAIIMKKSDKKFIVILCVMAFSCLISWYLYFKVYKQSDTVNIHLFPKTVKGWSSEELIISDYEYQILETDNAFSRRYKTEDGKVADLFIVYSENNRKVSHPPEICFSGGGFSITSNKTVPLKFDSAEIDLKAHRLNLQQGRFEHLAYYWFKVGNSYTASYWKQQGLITIKTLLGKPSSSALIRISAAAFKKGTPEVEADLKEFIQDIYPYLREYLP